jgi:hypothetical protein
MPFEITRSLEQHQHDAKAHVDELAGIERQKYITVSPGQEATYAAKLADAKAYLADAEAHLVDNRPWDASQYVWIKAEADALGLTPLDVASKIIAISNQWALVGAHIEAARQLAKQSISAATTVTECRAAQEMFKAALVGMG